MEVVIPHIGRYDMAHIWEPAAGLGHMSEVLREYSTSVYATDKYYVGTLEDEVDFLNPRSIWNVDWVITNPPFGKLTLPFVQRALDLARVGVAMFVRSQWAVEGCQRYRELFSKTPPTLMAFFAERVNLCKGRWDPDGTTATAYCWLVWVKGREPMAPFWIPPGQRQRLTRPDDRERFAAWSLPQKEAAE
jgi:hypothetical protein